MTIFRYPGCNSSSIWLIEKPVVPRPCQHDELQSLFNAGARHPCPEWRDSPCPGKAVFKNEIGTDERLKAQDFNLLRPRREAGQRESEGKERGIGLAAGSIASVYNGEKEITRVR